MPHPDGGKGNYFRPKHTFEQAFLHVKSGFTFHSTTGENILATQGLARDGITQTIVFTGERTIHGNVCPACWGFRINCLGARIGQCAEALDQLIP